jgi:alkylation response protein AidB-like acyl-CoA dehydrogenase
MTSVMTDAQLQALEAELRSFLESNGARRMGSWRDDLVNDDVVSLARTEGESEVEEVKLAKEWQALLFDAGFAWLEGPSEYGGRDLDPESARALHRVMAQYQTPNTGCFIVSHNIVGPTIRHHGTKEQKDRWLKALWRGDEISCQLFSEPEAGSDLASLRTTAVKDGDEWVINGQKVWTSGAHYSKVGELLARTGTPEQRHRGITAFLLEMDTPGVTIRPLRQMSGGEHFNEVFLDNVRIKDSDRLGDLNAGWGVAMTTLGSERSLLADESSGIVNQPVARLFESASRSNQLEDTSIQELLAEAWGRETIIRAMGACMNEEGSDVPPPSVAKLMLVDDLRFYIDVAARLNGPAMIADAGGWGRFAWSQLLLATPAQRIAGGTDEIQKNIIAERVLGLPKDRVPTQENA